MSLGSLASDPELQKFVATKELENQITAQVHHLTNICFDKCLESSGSASDLSARQTVCLQNCVERFLDCSVLITNRTVQRIQQGR
ncbi:unnamed protein product [Rotaria socialis]|uniref:Mitochondrial import inner membrane translocase subunit n=1 Tax=Rotaria socialis TaxID=392032 RepID=A0A820EAT8_9BILA|nr:unnamed protein product [Rotaria socialis]CAF3418677.1 unnamed protein product [Rotaria socialis]CAF3497041.1 unnamed protein product [Rotaria socialis]CAF3685174.1 unnamed protein product [Rotaria socialis]CAF3799041.1 unnamed protein product [Rotaria socialis]